MKKIFLLLTFLAVIPGHVAFAASESDSTAVTRKHPVEAGVGATLVSSYLWRGSQLDMTSIQADASVSWCGLTLDVWGSNGLVRDIASREIDLSLSYSIAGFSIGVTDYYCPPDEEHINHFFHSSDPHTIEVGVGYDFFGYAAINWYTNVFFDSQYSSYLEVSAPFSVGPVDFLAAVGCSPYKSDYYGVSGFNVINCSLSAGHEFEIGTCTIPLGAQLMCNPSTSSLYFAASVGISF